MASCFLSGHPTGRVIIMMQRPERVMSVMGQSDTKWLKRAGDMTDRKVSTVTPMP